MPSERSLIFSTDRKLTPSTDNVGICGDEEFQKYAFSRLGKQIGIDEFWIIMAGICNCTTEQARVDFMDQHLAQNILSVEARKAKAYYLAELNI